MDKVSTTKKSEDHPTTNDPLHIACKILQNVVVSVANKAETKGLFFYSQEAIPIRYLLEQLGHPQLPTSGVHSQKYTPKIQQIIGHVLFFAQGPRLKTDFLLLLETWC